MSESAPDPCAAQARAWKLEATKIVCLWEEINDQDGYLSNGFSVDADRNGLIESIAAALRAQRAAALEEAEADHKQGWSVNPPEPSARDEICTVCEWPWPCPAVEKLRYRAQQAREGGTPDVH